MTDPLQDAIDNAIAFDDGDAIDRAAPDGVGAADPLWAAAAVARVRRQWLGPPPSKLGTAKRGSKVRVD